MGRAKFGQPLEPMWMFAAKAIAPSVVLMFVIVQLARFHNLPWVLLLLGALAIIYSLITSRAVFGRHIYAIGGNLNAATLSGVKVKQVTFWLFVNMGVLSAVAGIIFAGRLNQAGPTAGQSFELDAISAPSSVVRRPGWCRQGGRRHHRWSDHGCDQQRDAAARCAERAGHAGQGSGAAARGGVRRLDQAPCGFGFPLRHFSGIDR